MAGPGEVQSVERAFAVLELIADSPNGRSVSQMATVMNLTPSTIHRTLKTLKTLGYLRQDGAKRYFLGMSLRRLGLRVQDHLGPIVQPTLEMVAGTIGELTNFAILDGSLAAFLAHVAPPTHGLRVDPGDTGAAHATGVGKAMLAQMSDAEVRTFVSRAGLAPVTSETITDPDSLFEELARIRSRGYAIDEGEHAPGVRCVAVALDTADLRSAISVSGPAARMSDEVIDAAVSLMREHATTLAAEIDGV